MNTRQKEILSFLTLNPSSSRDQLNQALGEGKVSRITVIRDLKYLIYLGIVEQTGTGKSVRYNIYPDKELLIPLNVDIYFSKSPDQRFIRYPRFNPNLLRQLKNLFTVDELAIFENGRAKFINKFKTLDSTTLKKELERFTIELSWKSSQIEGNTYSLLETEELIKNRNEAKGKDKSEAIMILNHKTTFDTILTKKETFRDINVSDIRSIHTELTRDLGIKANIRESAVGITGTKYLPLDNKWQIEEALSDLTNHLKKLTTAPEKALILLAMTSYLQPFVDGNKRTSRMVSNAILLANDYYPLSYRSIDEVEYKKAMILLYEQNNIYYLKQLFIDQQQFAIDNYFL